MKPILNIQLQNLLLVKRKMEPTWITSFLSVSNEPILSQLDLTYQMVMADFNPELSELLFRGYSRDLVP